MILSHDDEGAGPTLLLLHSGVCDRRMWEPLLPALRTTHRVVRPDLRGFGRSPLPPGRFSFAEDVAFLLDHLGIDRAVVVGSSLGGRVALEVAAAHPGRVESLVLLCPAVRGVERTPDAVAFGDEEDRLLEAGDVEGAVALNVATWLGPEATPGVRELVRSMQRLAFEVQLAADAQDPPPQPERVDVDPAAIDVPTLVVRGGRDLDHFRAVAEHLAATMPHAELVDLPWAAHLPSLERPDEVAALVSGFLGRR